MSYRRKPSVLTSDPFYSRSLIWFVQVWSRPVPQPLCERRLWSELDGRGGVQMPSGLFWAPLRNQRVLRILPKRWLLQAGRRAAQVQVFATF